MTSWRWCKRTGVKWILHWLDLKTDKCRFHAALLWSHLNDSYACFWTVNWYVREASEKTQVVPWNYKHYGRCCWHQLNRETVTDTSICPEKYLKHSFCFFFNIHFLHFVVVVFFLILLLENDKTFVQHRGRGVETRTPLVLPSTRRDFFFMSLSWPRPSNIAVKQNFHQIFFIFHRLDISPETWSSFSTHYGTHNCIGTSSTS